MNEDEFKEQHLAGLKGISHLYGINQIERSWPLFAGFFIALLLTIVFGLSEVSAISILNILIPLGSTIFPTILGFSLAGFALVIGFSSSSNFEWFTEKAKNEKGSLYQITIAIFSIHLILNFITVVGFILASLILQTKAYSNFPWITSLLTDYPGLKLLFIFALLFLAFYSLSTLPLLVVNIFNLSQANHSVASMNRHLKELEEISDSDKAKTEA